MATKTRRLADLLANIDDNSKVTSAGLLDATITAADLANDSVGAAGIIDDAVGAAAIADNAIDTAAKLGSNVVTSAKIADANVTAGKLSSTALASVEHVKPHIQPGLLYPAYNGKGLDGTTTISSFGTPQSISGWPTVSYYYTSIKDSKPLKDPRIGTHFGSQRHMFKSIQNIGPVDNAFDVHTVDGRDWIRAGIPKVAGNNFMSNDAAGLYISFNRNLSYLEVTGYFNAFNLLLKNRTNSAANTVGVWVNGVQAHSTISGMGTGADDPWGGRYKDTYAVRNINITAAGSSLSSDTPIGINTIKLQFAAIDMDCYGCELIVQDTADATRGNHVIVPAQNVVSYGKKFSIGSNTLTNAVHKHYNPFAFKTDGTTAWAAAAHNGTSWPVGTGSSHNIDTATSIGLEKWKHSSNYYKPYNGGRVVIWVDSAGAIKTSVNVMPPNARSIANAANLSGATAKANASIANNQYKPTIEAGAITNEDEEIAKTFHWREFGNGRANNNASWDDASMLSGTNDDIAFVMDDGLTCFSGKHIDKWGGATSALNAWDLVSSGEKAYYTFIGTGFSITNINPSTCTFTYNIYVDGIPILAANTLTGWGWKNFVSNLPYGTHVVMFEFAGSSGSEVATFSELSIHQPKKPPIPENACVLADYMLMAEHKPDTDGTQYHGTTSKGARRIASVSSGIYYNGTGNYTSAQDSQNSMVHGFQCNKPHGENTQEVSIVAFATNAHCRQYDAPNRRRTYKQNGVTISDGSGTHVGPGYDGVSSYPNTFLKLQKFEMGGAKIGSSVNSPHYFGFDVITPTHTSFHYQEFETPYTYDLVGGDRNMEQHNLIVTADGKSWEEVTRDTSYIGNTVVSAREETGGWVSNNTVWTLDKHRGTSYVMECGNKDWAISYDRWVCLKSGEYTITAVHLKQEGTGHTYIRINGADISSYHDNVEGHYTATMYVTHYFLRGDYVQCYDTFHGGIWASFQIKRV